jgi:hypothetical protein
VPSAYLQPRERAIRAALRKQELRGPNASASVGHGCGFQSVTIDADGPVQGIRVQAPEDFLDESEPDATQSPS